MKPLQVWKGRGQGELALGQSFEKVAQGKDEYRMGEKWCQIRLELGILASGPGAMAARDFCPMRFLGWEDAEGLLSLLFIYFYFILLYLQPTFLETTGYQNNYRSPKQM